MSFKDLKKSWSEAATVEFHGIVSKDIDKVWDEVAPLIHTAITDPDFEHIDLVYENLKKAEMQLWIGSDFDYNIKVAVVSEIVVSTYTGARRAVFNYVAGDGAKDWLPFLDVYLENFARQQGCTSCQIIGRQGWRKLIPSYKVVTNNMIREL